MRSRYGNARKAKCLCSRPWCFSVNTVTLTPLLCHKSTLPAECLHCQQKSASIHFTCITYRCQRDRKKKRQTDRDSNLTGRQAAVPPGRDGSLSDVVAMETWSQHHLTAKVASKLFLICVFQAGNRAARWQSTPDRRLFTQHALCFVCFSAVVWQVLCCLHTVIMC